MTQLQVTLIYINEYWNVYMETEEGSSKWYSKYVTNGIFRNGGEYKLRFHAHEDLYIYSFGFLADDPTQRPGHKGEWSSNAQHINKLFDMELTEVAIDNVAVAVPVQWLKTLFGDRVTWGFDASLGDIITHVKGHKDLYYNRVTFKVIADKDRKWT